MHLYQADPIYLKSPRLETFLEYSGAALVIVASSTRVSLHSKRSPAAVVARWERIFGRTSRLCIVLRRIAEQQTSG